MSFSERIKSRKFLSMVGAVLIACGSALAGQIEWSQAVWAVLLAVLGYMGVEGIADIKATKEGSSKRD